RVQPQHHLGEQAQRTEGAVEELGQVVSGDVLDDVPAGADGAAVGEHGGHPDDEVAQGAVGLLGGAGVGGGDQPAGGGAGPGPGGVEGDPLALLRQRALQLPPRDAAAGAAAPPGGAGPAVLYRGRKGTSKYSS